MYYSMYNINIGLRGLEIECALTIHSIHCALTIHFLKILHQVLPNSRMLVITEKAVRFTVFPYNKVNGKHTFSSDTPPKAQNPLTLNQMHVAIEVCSHSYNVQ